MNISKSFLEAVQQPDHLIDPAYCALLISQAVQPGLDIMPFQNQLRTINEACRKAGVESARALIELVSGKFQFYGDTENYFTIENSLLDKVIAKGSGIPISLGLIYMSAGKASTMSVFGINFPGHFLIGVKRWFDDDLTIIDPFSARMLTKDDCYELIKHLQLEPIKQSDSHFLPAGSKSTLLRLLENIKANYLHQGNAELALTCLDHQLMIVPEEEYYLNQQQNLLGLFNKAGDKRSSMH